MHLLLEESKSVVRLSSSRVREVLVLGAVLGLPACLFAAGAESAGSRMEASRHAAVPVAVREIDDPATGNRWLLERDPTHPGGPGRLVLVSGSTAVLGESKSEPKTPSGPAPALLPSPFRAIIRAGDRVVVEQNTAFVEARLEAVALGPARKGATFPARLTIGGKVVRAVALAPSRASLVSIAAGWRGGQQ